MKKIFLFSIILVGSLLCSCHHKVDESDKPGDVAIHYVQTLADGKYDEWVAGMSSCDSASDAYRKQMLVLCKQLVADKKQKNEKLKSVVCTHVDMDPNGKYANTYLRLTYTNDSVETILFPLIWKDQKWRIR